LLAEQLTDDERNALESHIEGCTSCQQLLTEWTRAAGLEKGWTEDDALRWSQHESLSTVLRRLKQGPADVAADSGSANAPETVHTLGNEPAVAVTEHWPHVPGYEVLDMVGQGGMGAVYRCGDPVLGRDLAIKVMKAQGDAELIGRSYG
jgi:hypothetical protein